MVGQSLLICEKLPVKQMVYLLEGKKCVIGGKISELVLYELLMQRCGQRCLLKKTRTYVAAK